MSAGAFHPTQRAGLLSVALAMVLGGLLLVTPQSMGVMCSIAWMEDGFQPPPVMEEEVVKHALAFRNIGADLLTPTCASRHLLPTPSDDEAPEDLHRQVAVPPPKAC